jgi:hypothetical protein
MCVSCAIAFLLFDREMMGTSDAYSGYAHMRAYFAYCAEIMGKVNLA